MPKLRSVVLDVAIDCLRCMRPVPIEAVGERARCRACGFELAMSAERWKYVAAGEVKDALRGADGASRARWRPRSTPRSPRRGPAAARGRAPRS